MDGIREVETRCHTAWVFKKHHLTKHTQLQSAIASD